MSDFTRFLVPKKSLQDAYEAGKDCAINGPTETNCHFSLFASEEMTKEWERGKKDNENTTS
jgi:hypothetical protein